MSGYGEEKSGENMFENIQLNIRQIQSNISRIESRINEDDATIRSSVKSSRSQASVDKIMASSEYFDGAIMYVDPNFPNGQIEEHITINDVLEQGENMRANILELFQTRFPNSIDIANSDLDDDDINIVLQEAAITIGRLVRIKQEIEEMKQEGSIVAINDKLRAIIEGISHEIFTMYLQLIDKTIAAVPGVVANVTSVAFLSTLLPDDIIAKFPDGRVKDTIRGLKLGLRYFGNGIAINSIIDKVRSHFQLQEITVDYINDTIIRPLVPPTIQCAGVCRTVLSSVNQMASTVLSKVGSGVVDILAWGLDMGKPYDDMELNIMGDNMPMSQLSESQSSQEDQPVYRENPFASSNIYTEEGVRPVASAFPLLRTESSSSSGSDLPSRAPVFSFPVQGNDLSTMYPESAEAVREEELTNEQIRNKYPGLTPEDRRRLALQGMLKRTEAAQLGTTKRKRDEDAEDDEDDVKKRKTDESGGGKRRRYGKSRRYKKTSKVSKKRRHNVKKGGRKTKKRVHKKTMKRHRKK